MKKNLTPAEAGKELFKAVQEEIRSERTQLLEELWMEKITNEPYDDPDIPRNTEIFDNGFNHAVTILQERIKKLKEEK